MANKIFLSIAEASDFLGVHPETLRRWDRTGKLTAEKVNTRGDRRYDQQKLQEFKDRVKLGTDDKEEAKKRIDIALKSLDKSAEEAKYLFAVGDVLKAPRDLAYFILEDKELSDRYQALLSIFNFEIKEDELMSKMSGTDGKGKKWAFPLMEDLKPADLIYLKKSYETFNHPRIKARIAHVLWVASRDHKMAANAVEEYLKLVVWTNSKINMDPESANAFEMLNYLESAYIISKKIKRSTKDVNMLIAENILSFNDLSSSKYAITHRLIEFALKNWKDFGQDFWENAVLVCKKMAQELEQKNNEYFARDFLSLGEKIETSVFKLRDKKWKKEIAESLEQEAIKKDDSFVQTDLLVKAIAEYKSLGEAEKVNELSMLLNEAKKNMKFQTFESSVDVSDWAKDLRKRLKIMVAKESKEQFLHRVATDKSIIPSYDEVARVAEKMDKQFPMQSLFSQSIIDSEGNTARVYDTELERKYNSILRQYELSFRMFEILIQILFEEAVKAKKIDLESVKDYFSKFSWFGSEYEWKDPSTQEVVFKSKKWIDVLSPGIEAYLRSLSHLEIGENPAARDNIILAVDSLVQKIEGLIREFYEKIGKPTDKVKMGKNKKHTTEKKTLDELLREPYAEEIFGKDLLLLMKFVLIEHGGFNLRNGVSHTMLFRENYQMIYAHLLFIIILRLGPYKFTKVEKKQS